MQCSADPRIPSPARPSMCDINIVHERCPWCLINEEMKLYHDTVWGVPTHDDREQFKHLSMEVMQCGLNWNIVLLKQSTLERCFADFDFEAVAAFGEDDITRITETQGMIRSPRKIAAIINNAGRFLEIRNEFGSFSNYIWSFIGGVSIVYDEHGNGAENIPPSNDLSKRISADMKKRGFSFVGPVTIYSHMQACGMINDHLKTCPRRKELLDAYPHRILQA